MTAYRYPGLFGDPRSGRIWPLFLLSAALHVGLFWAFSRLQIRPSVKTLMAPIQMVELGGGLGGPRAAGGGGGKGAQRPPKAPEPKKSEPAAPPAPPEPKIQQTRPKSEPAVKLPAPRVPKAEPKAEPKVAEAPPKPEPAPKTPPPAPRPAPDVQPIPKATASPEKAPAAPARKEPPRPKPEEGGEERVAEKIARMRAERASPEARVAEKVNALRERQIQGSEQRVKEVVEALRRKLGTREPGHGGGATSTGEEGPLGVSGGGGAGLQGFLESRYIQTVRDHLNLYWSVTETLKGKGYEAFVSVIVDRRGKIVNWSVRRSGNRLFDEKVERAVAEADPLPPVPNGMAGERFEFELRFSAP